MQDYTTCALGPQTESPQTVLLFLFCLPADDFLRHLDTSIYVPKDPNFSCQGGAHHPFDRFHCMATMPYLPNALSAFVKTHKSFHGVEPIQEASVRRDVLLYDVKVNDPLS